MSSSARTRLIYSSSNGDDWFLGYDREADRVFVQHRPNASSGGRATERDIGDFLTREARNPEHRALLRLIGTLVTDARHADDPRDDVAASSGETAEP